MSESPNIPRLILASTSPFRRKILEDADFSVEVMAPLGDEKSIFGLKPLELARRRSEFKGLDVAKRVNTPALVIAADQVLGMGGVSYDKADSLEEARQRLHEFSGKTHVLYSGFCVYEVNAKGLWNLVHSEVVPVTMVMRQLTSTEIETYIATNEWQGCVGCYRIEGEGRLLFESIGGDQSAIIGLPLMPLMKVLSRCI